MGRRISDDRVGKVRQQKSKIIIAVDAIVENILGALLKISEKINKIAIIPARTIDGLAPEINTNKAMINIEA